MDNFAEYSLLSPPPSSDTNTPQSTSVFYLELSAMLFICLVISLLFLILHINRQRNHTRPQIHDPDRSESDPEAGEGQGIGQDALEKLLPLIKYGQHKKSPSSSYCVICLESFTDDESCRVFPVCNHIFHSGCIEIWLKDHLTCPVCRISCQAQSPV